MPTSIRRRFVPQLLLTACFLAPTVIAAGRAGACSCLPPDLSVSYGQHSDVMRVQVLSRKRDRQTILYAARVQHPATRR